MLLFGEQIEAIALRKTVAKFRCIDHDLRTVFKSPRHSSENVIMKVGKQPVRQTKFVRFLGIL